MTKYISDTRICSEECGQQKNSPSVSPSLSKRGVHPEGLTLKGIKGGELSAGSTGQVLSGTYLSLPGAKVTGSR